MYLYDSALGFPWIPGGLGQSAYFLEHPTAIFSRLGEPPALSPDLVLDDFNFDKADLKQTHRDKIDRLEQQIVDSWKPGSNRPALGVRAVGHTDLVGGEDYNKNLGNRRAENVLGRLTGLLIGGDIDIYQRMTWSRESKGKTSPVPSGTPAQNRRVEIFIEWGRLKPPPPPPRPPDPHCVAACNAEERRCLDRTRFPPECGAARADCVRGCRGRITS